MKTRAGSFCLASVFSIFLTLGIAANCFLDRRMNTSTKLSLTVGRIPASERLRQEDGEFEASQN